ncbi:hypothetical protein Pmani_039953 [Petrolisthes manimaculis]|uniref:Uncharacterized protein n=1 Tax=Petrolisthes manimaculis TaxID=1843537 RepID=A0AAE1NCX0_9EUCA|nr:hypothetical protein Pmani_039953 [Petrolisthes manimaculis]
MESTKKIYITASLIAVGGVLVYWIYRSTTTSRRKPPQRPPVVQRIQSLDEVRNMKWERVGRVSRLCVYLVKSASSTLVQEAWVRENAFGSGRMKDR